MTRRRDRGPLIAGVVSTLAGAFFIALAVFSPTSLAGGIPQWMGASAGAVFLLVGVIVIRTSRGVVSDDLLGRVLVAVLLSLFAAVAMIFPPGGVFVVFFAVLGWMGVYRWFHQRATGRDPLAGVSDGKHLGIGCLVTIALLLVAILVGRWLQRPDQPETLRPERMPGDGR